METCFISMISKGKPGRSLQFDMTPEHFPTFMIFYMNGNPCVGHR